MRNVSGGAPAQFSQNIGVGLPRMCVHKFRAIFATCLKFLTETKLYGQKMSQVLQWVLKGKGGRRNGSYEKVPSKHLFSEAKAPL